MSEKIVQLNEEVIKGQIKELVRTSVEETLNELLEQEAEKLTQAARYERSEARQGYRSGHYDRNLTTTSGDVTLHVPRLKGVSFETAIIERYRRRESSVEEALIEMYLAGVSVRRVEDITEALWGSKVSPATISELNKKAYVHIEDWRNRPLQGGQSVKKLPTAPEFLYNRGNGGVDMERWNQDSRREPVIVDLDALVPQDHLLRKIERVMDYDWLYARLEPYYCHHNGRPGTDPVVLIKMVLIQHLFGIPSLRQTYQRIQDTLSYRWFLGYSLLDEIPHFATVSYAFCKRFPVELAEEIFAHILNKALNHRMVDPKLVFIDGTHIKASANKNKSRKQQVIKAAKVYAQQLRDEVNEERARLGKKPIEEEDDDDSPTGGTVGEQKVSTTDPESGLFVKGEHERQFAYEAHTASDRHGFVLEVEVTPGNVHDSVAWDNLYDRVTARFEEEGRKVKYVMMDAAYKTPWIAKKVIDGGKIPVLPYTRYTGKKDRYKPWDYRYDPAADTFTCPHGGVLRHTTTSKDGKRTYRSTPSHCRNCPYRSKCGADEKGQKVLTTHIWQEYLDLVEEIRKTKLGKALYAKRKETVERIFADAKEKHAMRYTHHRGLAAVTRWVRLKYAAMNLKKLALWSWGTAPSPRFFAFFFPFYARTLAFSC